MFSVADVTELCQSFAPGKKSASALPRLFLTSDGNELCTTDHLDTLFTQRITEGNGRLSVDSLAKELGVNQEVLLQIARARPETALISSDAGEIITLSERLALHQQLAGLLNDGVVSKKAFDSRNHLDHGTADILLQSTKDLVDLEQGLVYSRSYNNKLSAYMLSELTQGINEVKVINLTLESMPGRPSAQFAEQVLTEAVQSNGLRDKLHIQVKNDRFRCTPSELSERKRTSATEELKSGAMAYLNLQQFYQDFPELFATYEDANSYVHELTFVDILDTFAVSRARLSMLELLCTQSLGESGYVDLQHALEIFPPKLHDRLAERLADALLEASANKSKTTTLRPSNILATEAYLEDERAKICNHAKSIAAEEWQNLKNGSIQDVTFQLSKIKLASASQSPVPALLLKERATEKVVEEEFWQTIAASETENEAEFETFWRQRVMTRFQTYKTGLETVEDSKLRDQLTVLLAAFTQKELLPDTISKAQSQSILLSRKSRKNIGRLESILKGADMDVAALSASLDKFNKKQGVSEMDSAALDEAKQTMKDDLARKMQKQKDGPALFLTLVMLLVARAQPGIVYATGKFAPRLLKQLKSTLEPEEVEKLDKWKEAAKNGTLTAEDREQMMQMAEGCL